jgi:flagellar motor switch protein FliN
MAQTLSQEELDLLLNGVMPEREKQAEPDHSGADLLTDDQPIRSGELATGVKPDGVLREAGSLSGMSPLASGESVRHTEAKKIPVQSVQFMPLDTENSKKEKEHSKLELIYDVALQMTVELGRTEKTLKEVLEIGPGSVVGLDKLAGEPLDILVNGKLLARGEVIVIDENYGVRIKEILDSRERIGGLKA